MPKQQRLLSKTAFGYGLMCDRLFWTYQNARDQLPEPDEAAQAIFDQGHRIGDLAKLLHPGGIEIDWSAGHEAGIAQTQAAVAERKPIFEAGFEHRNTHARADILKPSANGKWDLIEVKSSTKVKEEHLSDVAFQKHLYEGVGIRIGRCFVMHVNRMYVRMGDVDVRDLFTLTDVTREIEPFDAELPDEIARQLSVMSRSRAPQAVLGQNCSGCALYDECWAFLPERNVFSLYQSGRKAFDLMAEGIVAIEDIPKDFPLTPKQRIQVDCEKKGKPYVETQRIQAFLERLTYPLYFLDFETFMTAVPPFDGMSPYDQVPFQYSLHVHPSASEKATHYSYLSEGVVDPRPEVLSLLKKQTGNTGSIVAYNAIFEKNVLRSCVSRFPKYKAWLESALPRFVDLLIPFREFCYYHPAQNGSASLKNVLPALTGRGYSGLEIADGQAASLRFLEMAFGNPEEATKMKIRKALETYCHQDTEGMIDIVKALQRLGNRGRTRTKH